MIHKSIPAILLFFSLANPTNGQNGCPACVVDLPPNLPADTLYLAPAPNGRAGEAYSADISFRVPLTTTPVAALDTTVAPGITINKITISGLTNLPPGLNWHVPQTVFPLPDSTDGCVRICGTPLQPGTYFVNVVITAQVFIFSQTATFTFPILIEPALSVTEGFTMTNASGCGEVTVSFTNNVPSGGNPGFSYSWNFGNGNFSPMENPVPQTYNIPGLYPVNYQAVIDTFGHVLTKVRINQVSCSDLFNGPDLKIFIYDPDSVEVFSSNTVQNASPPVEFIVNISIGPGNYRLRVIDVDDGIFGGADDECGTITFNRTLSGNLTGGPLQASIEIIHPTDTIRSTDTVVVFPRPDAPLINGVPNGPVCEGEPLTISTNYMENLQWYRDSLPIIPGGDEPVIDIENNGVYYVDYTSPDGCRVSSAPANIAFAPLPIPPVFVAAQNRLTLYDATALPLAARLQWYLDGEPIADATGPSYCILQSGLYTLEVVNLISGCASAYSLPVTFNPNFPNCVSGANDTWLPNAAVRVFPNPATTDTEVWLHMESPEKTDWHLIDSQGRILAKGSWNALQGETRHALDLTSFPTGLYVLRLQAGAAYTFVKIVKQ